MAKDPDAVIPITVQQLATKLGAPVPDWYVASAESERGVGAELSLREDRLVEDPDEALDEMDEALALDEADA